LALSKAVVKSGQQEIAVEEKPSFSRKELKQLFTLREDTIWFLISPLLF
jgi:hypothetical protein